MRILSVLFIFLISSIIFLFCKPQNAERAQDERKNETETTFERIIKSASATYISKGGLLNTATMVSLKYDYDTSGRLITITSVTGNMKTIVTHDSLERIHILEVYGGGKLSIRQTNSYDDEGNLIFEDRYEYEDDQEMHIEYSYPFLSRKFPKKYFRLNNRDTVAYMEVTRSNNTEFSTERSWPLHKNSIIIETEKSYNKDGKPVSEIKKTIMWDWLDKARVDTSYTYQNFEYNDRNQLIYSNENNFGQQIQKKMTYLNNAIATIKISNGTSVVFQHEYW
jgi:YD repeat-containing protein